MKQAGFLVVCLGLMGCGDADNGVQPCDLWHSSAMVSGHVTDASGAAVVGAVIDVQFGPCDEQGPSGRVGQFTTDANGNYVAELRRGNARGICTVSVAESGSGTSASGQVEFVGGCEDTRSPRHLNLDLVIP